MTKPALGADGGDHLVHDPVEDLVQVERRVELLRKAGEQGQALGGEAGREGWIMATIIP